MKKSYSAADTADTVWHEVPLTSSVYVCFGPVGEGTAVMVDRDDKKMLKTLYVFQSLEAGKKYAQEMGKGFSCGGVELGFLIDKLRSVYSEEEDHQVKCVLTVIGQDGILYELDVLWQLITN